jgi:hypothetical protein
MAEYVELNIDKGSTFSTTIYITDDDTNLPQNLIGTIVTSGLKRSLVSSNVDAYFTCITDPANTAGMISISMTAANTANLKVGSYFFDVVTTNDLGDKSRLIEGVVFVSPSITG